MTHVSGKRMITSGVDALSRDDTTKGVIKGNSLLISFPFHLGVNQLNVVLVPWVNSWWTEEKPLVHLTPDG